MEQLRQQLARLQQTKEQTDARLARMGDMRAEIATVEARVTAADRSVTVVAGPGGSVKNITFGEEARRLSPTQLSQVTMSTLRQAIAEAVRKQAGVMQEHLGESLDIVARITKTQEEAFAQAGETEPPQPASHPKPAAPTSEDDAPAVTREDAW